METKRYLIALLILGSTLVDSTFAQITNPRKLEIIKQSSDTTLNFEPLVKHNEKNEIIELLQEGQIGSMKFKEHFKLGKKWELGFSYDSVAVLYELSERGQILLEVYQKIDKGDFFDITPGIDKKTLRYIDYDYYPGGQLKYKIEGRRLKGGLFGKLVSWNVLEYYTPDGKIFSEWGDLKNGVGKYVILDDAGKICNVCTEKVNKK